MDKKYFLHSISLLVDDFATYKNGLDKLNYIASTTDNHDCILKHESVYNNPLYLNLFSANYSEVNGVLKYIEQCSLSQINITNDTEFERYYPMQNVGFMGIDFSSTTDISQSRQITNSELCDMAKIAFYKNVLTNGDKQYIEICMKSLYNDYAFEPCAIEDIEYWQNADRTTIEKIIKLIDDIKANPFTGGLGQTEVLKHENGIASKRINHVDRVTYSIRQNNVVIHRCRSHYE